VREEDAERLEQFDALALLCRRHGISEFDNHSVHLKFFPQEPARAPEAIALKHLDLGAPLICPCGHDEISHGDSGLCLQGCEPDGCKVEGAE
jgi:hypothetical protein